jgi:hypothetical protein
MDWDNERPSGPGEDDVRVEFDIDEGGDEDERLEADQRDDEDAGDDDARREQRRESRRRARERRKQFWREGQATIDTLRRQNEELQARLHAIESRAVDQDKAALDNQLAMAKRAFEASNKELKEAIETGDGDRHVKALQARERAALDIRQLEGVKQRVNQPQRPALDPSVENHARQWVEKNDWFDPSGQDIDSKVVLSIDAHLAQSRNDHGSKAYWEALDKEVRKRLPHKFTRSQSASRDDDDGDDEDDDDFAGPPLGGPSEPSRPSTRRERVYLTPERRKVLEDLGVLGDKKAMQPYLKEFADFDRRNKAR